MMVGPSFSAALAASSTSSFPRIPTWLATQQNITDYSSVQSIYPGHPILKDEPCAGVQLHVDTIENIHKLRICIYWN